MPRVRIAADIGGTFTDIAVLPGERAAGHAQGGVDAG
jgi:N-methylhydantoinase A/oxoprolinase/acetone carboxylase beta subunit